MTLTPAPAGVEYTIVETLHQGGCTTLYRALRPGGASSVVLKVVDPRRCRPRDLDRLRREYEMTASLDLDSIVRPLGLDVFGGMPALVLEEFGGESLDRLLGAPLPVQRFLALAIQLAGALADVHEKGVIHKDIKPENILFRPDTLEVKLTDFGIATRLPRERQEARPPELIEGSLPYMSPEQTGRMNRAVDCRSDLYSLGVTFYQMLTGRLPFEAGDPLEWVHCHLARAPVPPSRLIPDVPQAIERIVMKLLAKMAEDRYQTARGLERDLARCLAQWETNRRIDAFTIGEHDTPDRLLIPEKLYGRERELATLLAAFDRVVQGGAAELLLVSGYSGIGKSSVVNELHKVLVPPRGLFASGKFDQYKRDIPYATLAQAFHGLMQSLLGKSDAELAGWRDALREALDPNGQLMVDLVPELKLIIGEPQPVPELSPQDAQRRFQFVFRRFIGVFARPEHPLALFLDDLQWLDAATLDLLEDLLTGSELHHLLLIGAYRDNEVDAAHPLTRKLEAIRDAGALVQKITLAPLAREDVGQLVADALRCEPVRATPLAELVYEKTAGNSFFVIQFLHALADEGLLTLEREQASWSWDLDRIHAKGYTDNVVHLMARKLSRLPVEVQNALQRLACLGNSAEVTTLSLVQGSPEDQVHADLWEAVRLELIERLDRGYRFVHDRIQKAAYSLIPEGLRAEAHLRIGRLLAAHTPPEKREEIIFEIVNQLNRGVALMTSRDEREEVAQLNLIAGRRAKASTAHASALTYLAAGRALLPDDCWERCGALTFALELHRAECEFLTGALAAADERLSKLISRAGQFVDLAAVTWLREELFTTLGRSDRAVEACLEYLRRIGVEWSAHPTKESVLREYERIWRQIGGRSIDELVDLPPMSDSQWRATMDVLTAVIAPALFTDQNLYCVAIGRMANISLEHGNTDASCYAYALLGSVLGPQFGDYKAGFGFGKLAVDLVEKHGLGRFKARVYMMVGNHIIPWTKPIRSGREFVRRAVSAAQKAGDLTYSAYSRTHFVTHLLASGDPLGDVQREAEAALDFARQVRFGLVVDRITGKLRLIQTLRALTPMFGSFNDAGFDEGRFERHLEQDPRLALAACWYWISKLQARFFAGAYAAALAAAANAERLLWTSPTVFERAEYHFYGALTRAALCDASSATERTQHQEALAAHHRQIQEWAANCPENFENRAALVGAEVARIEGREIDAGRLYEQAIRSAREHGFLQNEALSYELASKSYRGRGYEQFAELYLREARACYARWGADAKVRQMDEVHPRIAEPRAAPRVATFAARPEQLDLLSVFKAAQTIAGEIQLEQLASTLLEVVLEQGGARRADLLLARDGTLLVAAEAAVGEAGVTTRLLPYAPPSPSLRLPSSVVQYARRTGEPVILADAASDPGKFASDEYLARERPRSVLCLPILRHSQMLALLYLENDLVPGVFTQDRLTALTLLASQVAISVENATFLANEQAARGRAAFLAEAGALLSESLDYEETLARLARLCVRSMADWCVIDVVEEGREVRRLEGAHADAAKEPTLRELQRRYPPRGDSPHPAARVLRSGEPLLLQEIPRDGLQPFIEDEEHARLLAELGTRSIVSVPLVARGQTLGVITLVCGDSGRRFARADLELAQELASRAAIAIDNARLYREAQQAIRVRDEFLSVASHELYTPITSLMLSVDVMMLPAVRSGQEMNPQTLQKLLDLVSRQGRRLVRLIGDLLDVSRIEKGRLPFEPTEVDLEEVVRDVVARLELDLKRAGCTVSIASNGGTAAGRWDRSLIDQVVTNLIANAIKFGAGTPVEIAIGADSGVARLVVRDRGIGISPDRQPHIFDRFERGVPSDHYGGLGLGLFISRRIVEAHGGSIRVESQLGEGATLTVELPCAGPPDQEQPSSGLRQCATNVTVVVSSGARAGHPEE